MADLSLAPHPYDWGITSYELLGLLHDARTLDRVGLRLRWFKSTLETDLHPISRVVVRELIFWHCLEYPIG